MIAYTPEQITAWKIAVAKLLPERIRYDICWRICVDGRWHNMRDTEWLQIVQWVEEGLTDEQHYDFRVALTEAYFKNCGVEHPEELRVHRALCSATTSQRLAALEAAGIIKV